MNEVTLPDGVAVSVGLENCLASPPNVLSNGRFGLLVNLASVDFRFRYAHDLFSSVFPGQLGALFSPQHGLWSEDQDNMIETPHRHHPRLKIPVYSLYAECRKPKAEWFDGLDCRAFRPYRTSVAMLASVCRLWPESFEWLRPPYEYETGKMPIDILSGGCDLRHGIRNCSTRKNLDELTWLDEESWWREVQPYLLYSLAAR